MTVAGADRCHFDRWFALVAGADFGGDLERLRAEIVGRLRSSLNGRRDTEAKLSHLTDLRHRLAAAGIEVADLVAAEGADRPVLAKARRKVGDQALEGRAMTPAMVETPRARLQRRARSGHWERFPVDPTPWHRRLAGRRRATFAPKGRRRRPRRPSPFPADREVAVRMPGRRTRARPSVLDCLNPSERAHVLALPLGERPELRADAERLATRYLEEVSPDDVADEVLWALENLSLDDLAACAGRQPGRGYVHENEAAWELLEEALRPFVDDVARRARLDMTAAAAHVALGTLAGLFQCREAEDGSVLAYAGAPDATRDLAEWVAAEARKDGLELSRDALDEACPDWLPLR